MKIKLLALSALMTATMGLTACDSHKENAVEDLNDAHEEIQDAAGEIKEAVADSEPKAVEAQAEIADAKEAVVAAEAAAMASDTGAMAESNTDASVSLDKASDEAMAIADDTTEVVVVEDTVVAK